MAGDAPPLFWRSVPGQTISGFRLADFFAHLGESVVFQVAGIAIKLANALGQLLSRHCVLVVHPPERFFIEMQMFVFARLCLCRVELAIESAFCVTCSPRSAHN